LRYSFDDEDMCNYINDRQLIGKYFSDYANFNTNSYNFNERFSYYTRYKNIDFPYDVNCMEKSNSEMDIDSIENGTTLNLSTSFFSKIK
jgi:hypothetical protein